MFFQFQKLPLLLNQDNLAWPQSVNFLQYCQPDYMVFLDSPPTHLTFPVALTYLLRHCSLFSCCRVYICLGRSRGGCFPDSSESACQCRRPLLNSWVRKICWRRDRLPTPVFLGFPCGPVGKESTCAAGDPGLIPGLRRSPGEVYALLSCKSSGFCLVLL